MDLINQINLSNNFVRPFKPIYRLTQTIFNDYNIIVLTHPKKKKKTAIASTLRFLAKKSVLFGRVLGLNTLCGYCFSHTTFFGLKGDKSKKVCTCYKV